MKTIKRYAIKSLGWLASACFALAAAPQAYLCYQQGNAAGFSELMLWMWLTGELGMLVYVHLTMGFNGPLLFNYYANLIFLVVIIKYFYWPVIV